MTREELIKYIKANDKKYNYSKVKFEYYTKEELILIYERIRLQKQNEEKDKRK